MSAASGKRRLQSLYADYRLAIGALAAAQIEEITAEQDYDRAWATAMLNKENKGTNKEHREAFCEMAALVERARFDETRANLRTAEANVRRARSCIAEIELLSKLICESVAIDEVF